MEAFVTLTRHFGGLRYFCNHLAANSSQIRIVPSLTLLQAANYFSVF